MFIVDLPDNFTVTLFSNNDFTGNPLVLTKNTSLLPPPCTNNRTLYASPPETKPENKYSSFIVENEGYSTFSNTSDSRKTKTYNSNWEESLIKQFTNSLLD